MISITEFDCQSCGACCDHKASWPILRRDRSDASMIPDHLVRKDLPLMKTIGTRCAALCGVVGEGCSCGIYAARPAACQSFQAGSALCLEARAAKGFPTSP
jgi:Fe-S-cluster containining protein